MVIESYSTFSLFSKYTHYTWIFPWLHTKFHWVWDTSARLLYLEKHFLIERNYRLLTVKLTLPYFYTVGTRSFWSPYSAISGSGGDNTELLHSNFSAGYPIVHIYIPLTFLTELFKVCTITPLGVFITCQSTVIKLLGLSTEIFTYNVRLIIFEMQFYE